MKAEYKSTIPHLTILAKYAIKHAVAFSGVESNAIVEAMEEYASEVTKDMYPKEFLLWLIFDQFKFYFDGEKYKFLDEAEYYNASLEEVFEYWQIVKRKRHE